MTWSIESHARAPALSSGEIHRPHGRPRAALDWGPFRTLGETIERAWAAHGHDPSAFPSIALEHVRELEVDGRFELERALEWILDDPEPQEPAAFADACLTLFRTEKFVVQINVWVHAGTTVHSHAFAGAFRVLHGASLHPTFSFVEDSRIAEGLLAGRVEARSLEYLRPGDARAIHPGLDGLNHALFHHERPSATLVVRTDFLPYEEPQYALFAPSLACAPIPRAEQNRIDQACGLLRALFATDRAAFSGAFARLAGSVDLPSVVQLVSMFAPQIAAVRCLEEIITVVGRRSPALAERLGPVFREQLRLRMLDRSRTITELDPRLNAVVGLLQWGRSRTEIEAGLARVSDRTEPCLAQELDRLLEASALSVRFPADLRRPLLDAALRGDDGEQVFRQLDELFELPPEAAPKIAALYRRMVELPELAAVFRSRDDG